MSPSGEPGQGPTPASLEAALVIPVPEAEPLVGGFRARFDPSAADGVPAHITINYPFLPRFRRPEEAHRKLTDLLLRWEPFDFVLAEVRTFPDVLYLAPHPAQPFLDLISSVAAAFPDSPPYGGQFEAVVPHLTVAQPADPTMLGSILAEFSGIAESRLPLACAVDAIVLIDNAKGRWATHAVYPLKRSLT
jgi:2'-5' RNA ligase